MLKAQRQRFSLRELTTDDDRSTAIADHDSTIHNNRTYGVVDHDSGSRMMVNHRSCNQGGSPLIHRGSDHDRSRNHGSGIRRSGNNRSLLDDRSHIATSAFTSRDKAR